MCDAKVIYIVGQSHSGSTLLTMLLGSHPQAMAVGELKMLSDRHKLWRRHRKGRACEVLDCACSCGAASILACPFWQNVETILHKRTGFGLDEIDLGVSDTNHFRQHSQALYDALDQASGHRYIVDSSKDLYLLQRLLDETDLAVRPILLVRRLEGIVTSNLRKGRAWLRTLLLATISLAEMRYALTPVEHLVIRYEDLASSPDEALRAIWAWIGEPFDEAWPRWTEAEHHLLAGNRMRHDPNPHIRVDDGWQQELTLLQKIACGVGNSLSSLTLFQRGILMWKNRPFPRRLPRGT